MNYSFFAGPPHNTLSKIAKQKPTRVLVSNLVKKYIIGFFSFNFTVNGKVFPSLKLSEEFKKAPLADIASI